MPINFPDNPTEGTQHTVGGITWQYDYSNAVWNVVTGGSAFRVSATAPSSPVVGDLWYDTESGEMFIYYDSAWVSPSVVATVAASVEVSATAPTAPAIGDLWFDSNTGDLTIYYDSQWVSPSVAASLATASASTITGTNSEGTSTSFARADHNHGIKATGAFYARLTTATTGIAAGSGLNIVFPTEDYDVSNWYDTSNGRFTPQVAGYYHLGCFLYFDTISSGYWQVRLGFNGGVSSELMLREPTDHTSYPRQGASVIAKANGTTDYFQINVFNGSSVSRVIGNSSYFYGYYIGSD